MRWNERNPSLVGCCGLLVVLFNLAATSAQQTSPSPVPASSPTASPGPPSPNSSQAEFVVIIDPAHGGEDKGEVFGPGFLEKDVTLSFARALRRELEQRGMAARMLRDTDANLTLQHRAELSNQQRSSVYVALHAGVPGKGVRVYSSLLASRQQPAGRFIAWENAQSASLDRSSALAKAVTREVQKRELKALNLAAFLRPLNNIVSPAIAVELTADYSDEHSLESQKLQTTVASAVASAIAQMRAHLGGRP